MDCKLLKFLQLEVVWLGGAHSHTSEVLFLLRTGSTREAILHDGVVLKILHDLLSPQSPFTFRRERLTCCQRMSSRTGLQGYFNVPGCC